MDEECELTSVPQGASIYAKKHFDRMQVNLDNCARATGEKPLEFEVQNFELTRGPPIVRIVRAQFMSQKFEFSSIENLSF